MKQLIPILCCLLFAGCGSAFKYDTLKDVCEYATEACELLPERDTLYIEVFKTTEVPIYYPECHFFGEATVYFDTDSYKIADNESLQDVLRGLNNCPEQTVVITGYCDERGTVMYNKRLGGERANEVYDWLVHNGIDRYRLSLASKGEAEPFVGGHSEHSWEKNRRATIVAE